MRFLIASERLAAAMVVRSREMALRAR